MDLKKLITMTFASVLAAIIFIVTLRLIFMPNETGDNWAIFSKAGESTVASFDDVKGDSETRIEAIQSTVAPEVIYGDTIYTVDARIQLNSLVKVKMPGSSEFVPGTMGSGFSILVDEVQDTEGNPVEPVPEGYDEATDDTGRTVIYNRTDGTIKFKKSGVYKVILRVYGENGRYKSVELKVPVEEKTPEVTPAEVTG